MKTTKNHRARAASLAGLALLLGASLGLPAQAIDVIEGGTECVPYEVGEERGQLCVGVPPEEPCEEACEINEPCDPTGRMDAADPCQPPPTCDPTGELVKVEECDIEEDECGADPVQCARDEAERQRQRQDCSDQHVVGHVQAGGANQATLFVVKGGAWNTYFISWTLQPITLNNGADTFAFYAGIEWGDQTIVGAWEAQVTHPCMSLGRTPCGVAVEDVTWGVVGGAAGWFGSAEREWSIWAEVSQSVTVEGKVSLTDASAGASTTVTGSLGLSYTYRDGIVFDSEVTLSTQNAPTTDSPLNPSVCASS